MLAMLDLARRNFGSHLGKKLSSVLGNEAEHDKTVHTDRFLDDLLKVLVKGWNYIDKKDEEKIGTLTGCPPVLYPDIMPHSF